MANCNPSMTLLDEIDRYLRASRLSDTGFGRRCNGQPSLVREIRNGRKPRANVENAIRLFIASEVARFKKEYP